MLRRRITIVNRETIDSLQSDLRYRNDCIIDLRWWYRYEPKKGDRILDLVADILDGDPFTRIGKPEPLKYIAANTWLRRIDLEHRLVYQVIDDRIVFLQARYHYED
jgi:toxin YoeB